MASFLSSLPPLSNFFPPTPHAHELLFNIFRTFPLVSVLQWSPLAKLQAMGKTSISSNLNVPGRWGWAIAEVLGPINLIFILYTLPAKILPTPDASTSMFGTGLPLRHEILGFLYILHYLNRAIISPLFLAPSMSPMHIGVSASMAIHQFLNSSNIACWIVYNATRAGSTSTSVLMSALSIIGLAMFFLGLVGNIAAENKLFNLRRAAAKRKAKSEGKPVVTYDKVYVIPPAEGLFKNILYPHYGLEWVEWFGYYVLGGSWGLGWGNSSAALWFLIVEIAVMLPRAVSGRHWYEQRFGKRAVAGRKAVLMHMGL